MTVNTYTPATTDTASTIAVQQLVQASAPKKLFIATQGCQMNEYDSGKIADILGDSHGYELTQSPDDADVLIMNTCSIREKAQEKVFSELGRWRKFKEKNPNVIIGVGGCVASQEGDNIQARAKYVDMVFGPQTLHRLPGLINQHQQNKQQANKIKLVDISFPEIEKFDYLPEPRVTGVKAYVSIMEGCSKYCSFCVVPYTRGEEVSRPLDDVLAEISSLAERGVREITLLGQNVNGYRGDTHDGNVCDFASLLYIIAEIPGIGRIRYTTSHPLEFSDALINAYKDIPALVSHLHLPVQSGSNAVLAGMKRNHTIDIYVDKINRLRAIRPDMHLASDFIIGFPGEGDAEFAETMDFINAMDFDHSYSFIFSKRPGTPAAQLPDDTSAETKKQRLAILKDVIKRSAISKTDAMLGTTVEVLVEKLDKNNPACVTGSAPNTRLVQMQGGSELIGKFVQAKVTRIASMNLVEAQIIEIEHAN